MMKKFTSSYDYFMAFIWLVPVLSFVFNPGYLSYNVIGFSLLGTIGYLFMSVKKAAAWVVPLVTVSPLAYELKIHNIYIYDIALSVVVMSMMLWIIQKKKFIESRVDILVLLILLFGFVSYLLSFKYAALMKGMVGLVFAYVYLVFVSKSYSDKLSIDYYISVWYFSSFLISLLILASYYNGVNLNSFVEGGSVDNADYLVYFKKGTFFFANIFYVIGVGLIIGFVFLAKKNIYFLYGGKITPFIFVVNVTAFMVYFNKTALMAILIVLFFLVIRVSGYRDLLKMMLISSFLFFVLYLVFVSNEDLHRIVGFSSVLARIEVYFNLFDHLFYNPYYLFFGMGPQSGLLSSDYLTSIVSHGNYVEGTVDSAYLSYLFEFGILFLFCLLALFGFLLMKTFIYSIVRDDINQHYSMLFFSIILYVTIVMIGQTLSTGKIGVLIFGVIGLIMGFCKIVRIHIIRAPRKKLPSEPELIESPRQKPAYSQGKP